jgi:putative tricarboxylic transport membrane protein
MEPMFHALFEFLTTPYLLLILLISTWGGAIVGGLPGLTATMSVALLVPFTFSMGPAAGLVAIGGLYVGAMYGDAIPACLINTPGTPSALATTFDGFPLTQQGKGQHALVTAGVSSAVGALIGGLALLLLSPPLAAFSLRFGPPEFFWVGVFGLTVIASLATGSMWKGLAGGTLGVLLSTIGIAPMGAHARYTFGFAGLQAGIHVVVALIGLFAVPQALLLVEGHRRRPKIVGYHEEKGVFSEISRRLLSHPLGLLRSSAIGTVVGILPGAGSPIAALISYNEGLRWSRKREEFGKGAIEGVAASEAANNSAAPASMIPLLTLGVPGSPVAAVVLGALLLHGLRPGQNLYAGSADIVYQFIWSMILAGFLIYLMSMLLSRYLVRIAATPVYFLAPLILLLSVIGSFAIRNNVLDVGIMLFFGILGYVLAMLGFQAGPIVLGLILGPIVESAFVTSLFMVRGTGSYLQVFFLRPISMVLIVLTVLSLFWPLLSKRLLPDARTRATVSEGQEE